MMSAAERTDQDVSILLTAANLTDEIYTNSAGAGPGVINGTWNSTEILYLRTHFSCMVFMFFVLVISAIVGTLGNFLVILTLTMIRSLRTCGNVFVINLALADVVICSTIIPLNAVGALKGEMVFMDGDNDNMFCNVIGSICAPACMSSMWNLCLISLNRYVLICHPQYYKSIYTMSNTIVMCILVWIICYMVHMPNHLGWGRISFNPDFYLCTADAFRTHTYAVFYIFVGVGFPLTGVLFGYTSIFLKVRAVKQQMRKHRRKSSTRIAPVEINAGTLHQVTMDPKPVKQRHSKTGSSFKKEDIRLAKTLFMAFFIFSLCWTPFALLILAGQPAIIPKWIYVLAMTLAHGNSAMNPVIYGLNNEKLREGYMRVVGCGRKLRARIGEATSMVLGNSTNGEYTRRRTSSAAAGKTAPIISSLTTKDSD